MKGMGEVNSILALYDFASKQEFIYRTSKIKEISGASELLTGIYKKMINMINEGGQYQIIYDTVDRDFRLDSFHEGTWDGEVLYDGGGNLMVLYRDHDSYIAVNRLMSVYLLKNAPTLQMIASCVECSDSFEDDVRRLYHQNRINKNFSPVSDLTAVTPMTQVDPMTFLPVVHKDKAKQLSLSADRVAKQKAYTASDYRDNNLDELDGMTAVVYIDGNSMGQKLKKCSDPDYNEGVRKLRAFSKKTNEDYVDKPLTEIQKYIADTKYKGYRRVVGGGDEITIICDARIALKIVKVYFETLKQSRDNHACAGIAIFHAKAPFTVAYEIAEAACESAKQRAHEVEGNYLDFYYCHAGITSDFETLRNREQSITQRPYRYEDAIRAFDRYAPLLQAAGRSNVKALGTAAQISEAKYLFEAERINAYLGNEGGFKTDADGVKEEMGLVYDMSEFYDLWFTKEGES